MVVRLVPFGFIYYWILEYLSENLPKAYGVEAIINRSSLTIPRFVYDSVISQIMSEKFLDYLRVVDNWPRNEKILAIVDGDAYARGTNFVFGQAEVGGRFGAVFIARLNPSFYGGSENDGLFLLRILKEASHELGHMLGLGHCDNARCVMSFSNSIWEVDKKGWMPCDKCRRSISLDSQA